MGRITIHLPDDLEERVRNVSSAACVSMSAWITKAVQEELEGLPGPEITRWFGSVPALELPTRKERWSKDEP